MDDITRGEELQKKLKNKKVITKAAKIPTASANKPADKACFVLVTLIEPKYKAKT